MYLGDRMHESGISPPARSDLMPKWPSPSNCRSHRHTILLAFPVPDDTFATTKVQTFGRRLSSSRKCPLASPSAPEDAPRQLMRLSEWWQNSGENGLTRAGCVCPDPTEDAFAALSNIKDAPFRRLLSPMQSPIRVRRRRVSCFREHRTDGSCEGAIDITFPSGCRRIHL